MGKNRPIKDSEKAELWTRASGGGDGSWIMALSRPGVLLRAKNTTEIPEDVSAKEYSTQYTDKDWTGTAIKTDDGYYPGTQKLLEERLGNNADFVDTYYRGIVPFESLGMIRKKKAPDRHVLRTAIKEIEDGGRDVKTYQTYRDTLDRNVVSKLDSLMNAGQFELIEKDSDGMNGNTGFRIGDSDIYYDAGGYNTVQITDSDGRIYEKDIDMLDFNPDHWRHKIQFPGAKKALSFLHSQGNPFIVTTPWRDVTVKPDFWKWAENTYGIFFDENGTLVNPNGLDLNEIQDEWDNIPGQVYKKGGRIHIKKKNRGKFTEYCGGKVTEECIARGKRSKNPLTRKRANFASVVRKWKHENGGTLKAQEGTGNLYAPHPLSPVGIALNQAKAIAKGKKDQQHLPPGVKEAVGPDGKKVAIRTEQPLVPLEQSIAEWLPGTGDVAEVGYIVNDIKNGNLGSAALAAAMVALPGNVGKVFRKSDVPVSKLTEAERLGIPKGERNQPLNGHLKGDAAVQMFKEYGTQFPEDMVRLYRASGTSGNFKPSLDGTAKYSGMWFTDNPRKVNRYASSTFKTAKRNGVDNPIVLEYIDIPKSQLDQFRAKNIIKGNDVEFEPTEDFLIPIDHTGRKQVSWTGFTGNYLSDMRIPHPELPLISKNSKIYSQIQQLVPEARERYKLVGRTDITDDEIAGSLYKRAMELNGNGNAAVWTETGEPRLLFRGDTRRYNRLMDKWSPEKLAKGEGTMDNSLGNLFLGDISGKGQGVDRYFISGTDFWEPVMQGSSTGARGKFGTIFANGGEGIQGTNIPYIPKDAYKLSTYQTYHGPYSLYKFPGKYSESGISDLNAFITRTPAMRDATGEISVLADDIVMKTKNYRGPNIDDYDGPTYDGVNSTVRDAMAKHYQSVLDDAQSKGQGLLFSEGLTDEYVKKFGEIHPFRREHEWYDYYALPNFNRQNAKHLFGWDLRRPVQWDIDNIYLEKGGKL